MVQEKLQLQWSPEQIAGWLRTEHPDRPAWHVCHETIYRHVYGPEGREDGLYRHLPKARRRRGSRYGRRPRSAAIPRGYLCPDAASGEDGRKLSDVDWIEAALTHEISGGGGTGGGG